jgi:hypothetical protein
MFDPSQKRKCHTKEYRLSVWGENLAMCNNGQMQQYLSFPSYKYEYEDGFDASNYEHITLQNNNICKITIKPMDPIALAITLKNSGHRPLLVNVVNPKDCGNNVGKGGGLYEEIMYLRTNLVTTVNPHVNGLYPLDQADAVYSPVVQVIRDEDYQPCEPYTLSVVSVAPLMNVRLSSHKFRMEDAELMRKKIELIFQVALRNNHDCIVMTDFGSFYRNPIDQTVEIINAALHQYKTYFKQIMFGIITLQIFKTNNAFIDRNDDLKCAFEQYNKLIKK